MTGLNEKYDNSSVNSSKVDSVEYINFLTQENCIASTIHTFAFYFLDGSNTDWSHLESQ